MLKTFAIDATSLENFRSIVSSEPRLAVAESYETTMGCSGCSGTCYFACQNDCKHDCSGDCGMTCVGGSRDNDGWA